MKKYPVSDTIQEFSSVFENSGFSLYIVGGAIRDYLLGIPNSDYDFCTDATPDQVVKLFKHVIPTGIKHGTVTVLFKGNSFEVTTFRTEGNYTDRRHPDNVSFVTSLEEDLSRRDFTVNAFAADCKTGEIIDLFNGENDLNNNTIRAIGNPKERFSEDPLRILRMCRFSAKLGFTPEESTKVAASELCSLISCVSQERIFEEIDKTLASKVPSIGFDLMYDIGLLELILPELAACKVVVQNKVGSDNVLEHILNSVDESAERGYIQPIRWALLLHDIGKVSTMKSDNGNIRFYSHDIESAKLSTVVLSRLKASNSLIDFANLLISNHMVKYNSNWTDGAVKRFINRMGIENTDYLFELQWCDQVASEGVSKEAEYKEFIERIAKLKTEPLSIKDLKVSGEDLYTIGIPKNKEMGIVLNKLLEAVLDEPSLNKKEILLERALSIYNS